MQGPPKSHNSLVLKVISVKYISWVARQRNIFSSSNFHVKNFFHEKFPIYGSILYTIEYYNVHIHAHDRKRVVVFSLGNDKSSVYTALLLEHLTSSHSYLQHHHRLAHGDLTDLGRADTLHLLLRVLRF